MSVAINNLINFSRALPEPMDKLTSKKIKVSSKYGSGTEATLSATVIKAVHAVIDCMNGTTEGAVGVIEGTKIKVTMSSCMTKSCRAILPAGVNYKAFKHGAHVIFTL